jgi:hypothetical protein
LHKKVYQARFWERRTVLKLAIWSNGHEIFYVLVKYFIVFNVLFFDYWLWLDVPKAKPDLHNKLRFSKYWEIQINIDISNSDNTLGRANVQNYYGASYYIICCYFCTFRLTNWNLKYLIDFNQISTIGLKNKYLSEARNFRVNNELSSILLDFDDTFWFEIKKKNMMDLSFKFFIMKLVVKQLSYFL